MFVFVQQQQQSVLLCKYPIEVMLSCKRKKMVSSVGTAHCLVTSPVAQALCSHFVFTLLPILPKL